MNLHKEIIFLFSLYKFSIFKTFVFVISKNYVSLQLEINR
jgi:hypothetical protein